MVNNPTQALPTVDEILARALSKERQAHDFYANLASQCPVEFVRELLEKLRDEENKHVAMITTMQARLNLGQDPISEPS